jgi:hypothetical protein
LKPGDTEKIYCNKLFISCKKIENKVYICIYKFKTLPEAKKGIKSVKERQTEKNGGQRFFMGCLLFF